MNSKCGTITKHPLNISSKYLGKCNREQSYGYQVHFILHPQKGLRPFQVSCPFIKKLYNWFHSRGFSLSYNYIIKLIITSDGSVNHYSHSLFLEMLTPKQRLSLNSPLINMDNKKNEFLPSFNLFNCEFSLGNCLIDSYSDRFSFHPQEKNVKNHIKNLDNITIKASNDLFLSIVVSDMSIKNCVATSILHIHMHNKPIIKMIHHAINITSTKAKLFAICCGIN